ncbi:sulfatase-like hydrolase/transferase [Leeia sp. TBRC 13508]|uniref:Sulfatase-like hydrolase/transferase n=1 Tax=Leeia speluncae TaxID=2884804 RepID=A0ABS8D176_9NEIS|nr:alkaline phosphatase family protein [Leeia speluncae]MCB6181945.1 sulfatase-like hydrolase/transferase [Leeia speluncae]
MKNISWFDRPIFRHRFSPVLVLTLLIIGVSFITRIALLGDAHKDMDWSVLHLLQVFGIGLFYDLVAVSYFIVPLVIYLWLIPEKIYHSKLQKVWLHVSFIVMCYILIFTAASEWVFWGEFGSRFNFIAVDYLLYTHEVIENIKESYPVGKILSGLTLIAIALWWSVKRAISSSVIDSQSNYLQRTKVAVVLLLLPVASFYLVTNKYKDLSENAVTNQLAGNGIYEFFAANLNNELDYATFYSNRPNLAVFQQLRTLLKTPEATFVSNDPYNLARQIKHDGPEKRLNVVLISIESMSADFMDTFGNNQHITPVMDDLAKKSLLFTNLYASGTRTVRGLEALSLALPPTPGQSIVRRPDNENLFSLGYVFKQKGYDSQFLYGGYGYFDNMNQFFSSNSYRVVDRTSLTDKDIHFENVWGVADEDLFTLSLREMDKAVANGKPFFSHIMTTSNHRPFTYPDGRIDISPKSKSREGGVKYTDWAIGDFIKRASQKPWFDNTVFVITADHCAASAGKTSIPLNRYHIPMLIYSPKHIQPGKMERLMGQVDIAPTLLGLLNFNYTSHFFGYDMYQLEPGRERLLLGTYQDVALIRNGQMAILSPKQVEKQVKPNFEDGSAIPETVDPKLAQEAVSWYQGASEVFRRKLSRHTP